MLAVRALISLLLVISLSAGARADEVNQPLARFTQTGAIVPVRVATESLHRASQKLEQIRTRWRQTHGHELNADGRVKRVAYLFASGDLSGALANFTGPEGQMPEEILMIDKDPFGTPGEVIEWHQQKSEKLYEVYGHGGRFDAAEGHSYIWSGSLSRPGGVGAMMLIDLQDLGATDIEISYLGRRGKPLTRVPGKPRREYVSLGKGMWQERDVRERRDIVEVSFELAGKRRTVLFVQQDLFAGRRAYPKVMRDFLSDYDGYLEKAVLLGGNNYSKLDSLRLDVLTGLRPDGVGILENGALPNGYEPTGRSTKFGHSYSQPFRRAARTKSKPGRRTTQTRMLGERTRKQPLAFRRGQLATDADRQRKGGSQVRHGRTSSKRARVKRP